MRVLVTLGAVTIANVLCDALSKTIDYTYLNHNVSGLSGASSWTAVGVLFLVYIAGGAFLFQKFGKQGLRWQAAPLPNFGDTVIVGGGSLALLLMLCSIVATARQYGGDTRVPPSASIGFHCLTLMLTLILAAAVVSLIRDLRTVRRHGGWHTIQQIEAAREKEESAGR